MADGCVRGISRVRWMSRTSGRSFDRFPGGGGVRMREPASCNSRASGSVDKSESSTSISLEKTDDSEPADDLRHRFADLADGWAQFGTGCRSSNCLRRRLVYSLPLTISSLSLIRSFLSRGFPANDTASLSSSLSSHAGMSPLALSSGFGAGIRVLGSIVDGPASRKKS
jgi:hypothetical protein